MEEVVIYTDGGSRGNPGPAALGAVLNLPSGKKCYSKFIGDKRTNNEAEYEALIFALKKTKSLLGSKNAKAVKIRCFLDSELIVKQLNHEYKIKNEKIKEYFIEIWNLQLDFYGIIFVHVRRDKNKEADALVNKALDEEASKMF